MQALPSPWTAGGKAASLVWCLPCSLEEAQPEALWFAVHTWATLLRCARHQKVVPGNAGERPMGGTFFHGCSCLHSTCTSWFLLPTICWHFSFTQWMQTAVCLMRSCFVFFILLLKDKCRLLFSSLSELQEANKINLKLLIQLEFPDLYFMLFNTFFKIMWHDWNHDKAEVEDIKRK